MSTSNHEDPREEQYESLSPMQQHLYDESKDYPEILKSRDLKAIHLYSQYFIVKEGSDKTLLTLLPPEPKDLTAIELVEDILDNGRLTKVQFKMLLPFVIYEWAMAGYPVQCDGGRLGSLVSIVRDCIENYKPGEFCQDLAIQEVQSVSTEYPDGCQDIIIAAGNILDISYWTLF